MAIAKKPVSKNPPTDAEADRFIAAAGVPEPASPQKGRVATMVRFDADLLGKVDAAAKKRGISRSAWIQYTLSKAIEGGEG